MKIIPIIFLCVFALTAQATVYTVTNTNTSGAGSLHAAITTANTAPGAPHSIVFNIPVSDPNYNAAQGVWIIHITNAARLPYILGSNISIDASTQTSNVGNTNPDGPEIVLDGGGSTDFCFFAMNAANITIRGFNIRQFTYGIQVSGSTSTGWVIAGNYIGTNEDASDTAGCYIGVELLNFAGYATIGGLNAADRNIISGNEHIGLRLLSSSHNTVINNYIGIDRTGTFALRNYDGLSLEAFTQYNQIGGNSPAARNVISGNVAYGLPLIGYDTQHNIIQGNYIGTNASGTAAVENTYGILFDDGSHYNTVGGLGSGEGNLLSGNSGYGLFLYNNGTTENWCYGNLIGTDFLGTSAVPNGNGVVIDGIATRHVLDKNVISGNIQNGIAIHITGTNEHHITRNFIGTDITGTLPLGNGADGIRIAEGGQYNIIGGPDSGNVIAYNGGNGITVLTAADYGNTFSENLIYGNAQLGIDLYPQGVTVNDAGDSDAGANQLMNFPVLDSASFDVGLGKTTLYGHLDHPLAQYCRVEFFGSSGDASGHGQANEFLGNVSPAAGGTFSFEITTVLAWNYVTATATDSSGNTSEFALNLELPGPNAISEQENENIFIVYPNPASDFIFVENSAGGDFQLQLINSAGQIVLSQNYFSHEAIVDVASLERGAYLVVISYGAESDVFRIQLH
ncbi:MAG TPA: T9SS type A sorting domain-containing protein [Bacteroidales bacterium]|nr:T9SS type A sorting domain-containing protein [Bacteroidales bacterium]